MCLQNLMASQSFYEHKRGALVIRSNYATCLNCNESLHNLSPIMLTSAIDKSGYYKLYEQIQIIQINVNNYNNRYLVVT